VLAVVLAGTWAVLEALGDGHTREAGRHDQGAQATAKRDDSVTVAGAEPAPAPIVRFTVGRGARSAAIVRRAGARGPQPVVLFFHGWGIVDAAAYRRWIRHLAALGNTVVVPRYQRDADADPRRVRGHALAGIDRALERVSVAPGQLVVAGHSAGAALAVDYAATAGAHGLPRPVAIFAVYPGRRIRGYPAGIPQADVERIPATTHLTVLASSADAVVGSQPARELVRAATVIPPSRRRLVMVTAAEAAGHYAPTGSSKAVRRAFWRPLDRLMQRARR
jgi:acetyl esterase/lipase